VSYTYLREDDPGIEVFMGTFRKVRRALGTNAFGLNEVRLPPGAAGAEHDEADTGHDEVYVIIAGGGTFTVDGEQVDVRAGDYLRVEPGTMRQPVAGPDGLRFLAIGAKPQPAYDGRESL
jgi:mannose-6-phosphate isomerase-like protein (cupin superfamily)